MQTTKTAAQLEDRARKIGAAMVRLETATGDAETYMAVTKSIVADAEKDDRGIFTCRGMDELLYGLESAIVEFEDDSDDSIERAERAAGA